MGNNAGWTPVWRKEVSYTATVNLTKVQGRHEIRTGLDFVRLTLDHWQPEVGNPRGNLSFSSSITGIPGFSQTGVGAWNSYAAFLLGQMSGYGKSVQFEEMTGRENQYGLYLSDRWQVNEKLTVNLGLRYEYYPLMSRADRGLELLNYQTFNIQLGGLGGNPKDLGMEVDKALFAPRLGLAYRIDENTVFRAGYGRTFNPMPWSRPMRGFYPATIAYSDAGPISFIPYGSLANGIPGAPNPDIASGNIPLPRNVDMRSPDPDDIKRGSTQSWNMFIERRLPLDLSVSAGYVGTRTDEGYADININYAESGGNANRQFAALAGNASILDWAARTRARYHALQMAVNRPFKGGFLLKGAYTFSKALNETDDDGWTGVTWNQPSQYHRNYARAGFDRPHMLQMGFVYELPFMRESTNPVAYVVKNWQVNGIASCLSGTAVHDRPATTACCSSRVATQTINVVGDAKPGFGEAGPNEQWYDPAVFDLTQRNAWGNSGRNAFRGPSNWNLDASLFRTIPFGHYRAEIRVESQNVFNHAQFGNPVTGFTDPNFLRIREPGASRRARYRWACASRSSPRDSRASGRGSHALPRLFCAELALFTARGALRLRANVPCALRRDLAVACRLQSRDQRGGHPHSLALRRSNDSLSSRGPQALSRVPLRCSRYPLLAGVGQWSRCTPFFFSRSADIRACRGAIHRSRRAQPGRDPRDAGWPVRRGRADVSRSAAGAPERGGAADEPRHGARDGGARARGACAARARPRAQPRPRAGAYVPRLQLSRARSA